MDHLNGKTIMDWSVSEGTTSIDYDFEDKYDFQKEEEQEDPDERIHQLRRNDPTHSIREERFKTNINKGQNRRNIDHVFDMYRAAQKGKKKSDFERRFNPKEY
mmetsp:Transcript_12194/g.12213  ORF Transcript_12194/g.12213 Transcript_12194/m.12213 type:complete len:103 (+) Transcript_12194:575-883(+)